MEDEGDMYDGIRAQFPLSFGKQSKSQTSLESIHNATRRSSSNLTSKPSSSSDTKITNELPSLSSSSKAWLVSLRNSKNPNSDSDHDGAVMVGPPRPPADEDDGGAMIGPPRPPVQEADDDDGEMIGPPRPPPASNLDASSSDDELDEDEVGNRFRIPLSNEIVLKGHTKVFFSSLLCSFLKG